MSCSYTLLLWLTSDEEKATKQSELSLLMDEVERAQTRLLSLEREKVFHRMLFKLHVWIKGIAQDKPGNFAP